MLPTIHDIVNIHRLILKLIENQIPFLNKHLGILVEGYKFSMEKRSAKNGRYIEPVSIHGGKIYGMFKVEGAAALYFQFDLKEGQSLADIKPENKVVRMVYPEILDDSF